MRGKSIDTEFVVSFMQNCIKDNKTTPTEICEEAIRQISMIDEQLKLRTKLTDVLSHFNYKKKISEAKKDVLSLDKINKSICNDIFSLVKDEPISMDYILATFSKFNEKYKQDIIFTFKQLLEAKILSRMPDNTIMKGELFNDFNEPKVY
jgi:hypothetical protein